MTPEYRVFYNAIKHLIINAKAINTPSFKQLVDALSERRSWLVGMGKTGCIARKAASTLASHGRPSAFIQAAEAGHGDMGAMQFDDVLVAFSNSGKTSEVIQVVEKAKEIGALVAVITSGKDEVLSKMADITVFYEPVEEACPLGLTPTTSVMVVLAIADALVMGVQKKVGLTYRQYAINHHSGYLGEKARELQRLNGE